MPHPDDEFLSALLDGQPVAGDAAHVDGCDACQSRLDALRSVTVAVGAVPPAPAHIREATVSAVVRTAETSRGRFRRPMPVRSGHSNTDARPRRMNSLSAAAALVVALAVGGLAISQLGSGPSSSNSNAALKAGAADGTTRGATAAPEAADSAAGVPKSLTATGSSVSGGPAVYDAGDLGEFADAPAVARRASTDLSQNAATGGGHGGATPSPCPYQPAETSLWQATLTYNGEAAVAHLVQLEDSTQIMQILRRADCSVIVSQAFAPTNPR